MQCECEKLKPGAGESERGLYPQLPSAPLYTVQGPMLRIDDGVLNTKNGMLRTSGDEVVREERRSEVKLETKDKVSV